MFRIHALSISAVALGLSAAGCTATIEPPSAVVTTDDVYVTSEVPVDIYAYPRVWYGGTYVYLVDGRWYAPRGRGWVIYRREPQELSRYRTNYQRSSPAPRRHYEPYRR